MSEATADSGTVTTSPAGTMPVARRWNVDVLTTSRKVVTVESFTRSEARQRAKNAAFWVDEQEATEVVKSRPSGTPRELDANGNEIPIAPKAAKADDKGKK